MRIAILTNEFPSLSTPFINNQITGLLDRGHEVDIYAQARGSDAHVHADVERYGLLQRTAFVPEQPRSRIHRAARAARLATQIPGSSSWALSRSLNVFRFGRDALTLKLFYRALPLAAAPSYDVVHAQFGDLGVVAQQLREVGVLRGKLVVHFRGYDVSTFVRQQGRDAYRTLFRRADLLLPNCFYFKKLLIDLGAPLEKMTVHRSAVDCTAFSWACKTLPEGGPVRILTIARLTGKKGIEYAVEAVARLKAEGYDVQYDIIGEGPLRPDLENLIRKLGVQNEVHLRGGMNHQGVIDRLRQSHLFVAPSVTGTDGDQDGPLNVLKEAMLCGLPVVSTQHGGIPELVEHGVSGYLAPERDSDGIAKYLRELIQSPERWPEMGRAGRARVEAAYDSEKLNDGLVHLYEQITAPTPHQAPANGFPRT